MKKDETQSPASVAAPRARRGSAAERPSIYDVAASAGVSIGTVSRVLTGRNKEVWPSTVKRADHIRKVARELGYTGASWRARAFASRRTHTIALVNVASQPFQMSEVYEQFFSSLSDRFFELKYEMQVVPVSDAHGPRSLRLLGAQRFDGCVVVKKVTPEVDAAVRAAQLPVVVLNARGPKDWPSVLANDEEGAVQLTRHLLSLGHRRMAFATYESLSSPLHDSYGNRIRGMQRALAEAGAPPLTVLSGPTAESVRRIASQSPRPTAAVTFDDRTAIQWLQACWRIGLRVPQDVSMATFNDSSLVALAIPPLTVMSIPTDEMARCAADRLIEELEGTGQARRPMHRGFDLRLVVRESVASME
jgi:DNA-binding LacI/PurR family transcriptional regulator